MPIAALPGGIEADDERAGRRVLGLARPGDQYRRDVAVVAAHLERLGGARRVFLLEQQRIAELLDLRAPPGHLIGLEPMERSIFALLGIEPERPAARNPVLVLPVPWHEDRDVLAPPGLGLAPFLVEEIADAVGGALQHDLGAGLVRYRLQHARRVGFRIGPERDFGSVEEL